MYPDHHQLQNYDDFHPDRTVKYSCGRQSKLAKEVNSLTILVDLTVDIFDKRPSFFKPIDDDTIYIK